MSGMGGSKDFENGGALSGPTKKILCFRWSKKAKITLEATTFWQNIFISVFKFSTFLYTYIK